MLTHGICRFVDTPVLQETPTGVKFSNFSLAWNESRKDAEGNWTDTPHFFDFEVWSDGAEALCRKFEKGDPVYVEQATPRMHTWVDKTSGKNRSKIVFRLDRFKPVPPTRNKTVPAE